MTTQITAAAQADQTIKMMKCNLLNEKAAPPKRMTEGSAGYDVFLPESLEIPGHSFGRIKLGFSMEMPLDHFGLLKDRSSMVEKGLAVFGGVIDNGTVFVG